MEQGKNNARMDGVHCEVIKGYSTKALLKGLSSVKSRQAPWNESDQCVVSEKVLQDMTKD